MQTVIADNLHEAQRGGVPSTYNLVSSFVGLRFQNQNANTIIGKFDFNYYFRITKTISHASRSFFNVCF